MKKQRLLTDSTAERPIQARIPLPMWGNPFKELDGSINKLLKDNPDFNPDLASLLPDYVRKHKSVMK